AAAVLPVVGLRMPESWRVREAAGALVERVTLEEASRALAFPLTLPRTLPAGFSLASVELVHAGDEPSITLYYRAAEVDVGSGSVRLHLESARALPPASAVEQFPVDVAGVRGRWTPDRTQLEWVDAGVYHSLDVPEDATGLELEDLLAIAASIPPDEGS
ncbi:MAG: hypothetical protein ACRDHU_10790, partial [Actinomycetota bacterium]